eukprot:SAG22_NODE_1349_length_4655_cov_6.900132_6_plen_40_part_00
MGRLSVPVQNNRDEFVGQLTVEITKNGLAELAADYSQVR